MPLPPTPPVFADLFVVIQSAGGVVFRFLCDKENSESKGCDSGYPEKRNVS